MKNRLIEIKEQIETGKAKIAEYTGQKKYLMDELKNTWGCTTIPAAEKKLTDIGHEIEKLTKSMEENLAELERKYTNATQTSTRIAE